MNENGQPDLLSQDSPAESVHPETPGAGFASQSSLFDSSAEASRFSSQFANGPPRSVDLHIDELVLNGFAPADRYTIGEAVERELARLFSEHGVPPAISERGETAHLDIGAFELVPGSNGRTIGVELAKAIYGGLDQ